MWQLVKFITVCVGLFFVILSSDFIDMAANTKKLSPKRADHIYLTNFASSNLRQAYTWNQLVCYMYGLLFVQFVTLNWHGCLQLLYMLLVLLSSTDYH
jgi:hypothetical protein